MTDLCSLDSKIKSKHIYKYRCRLNAHSSVLIAYLFLQKSYLFSGCLMCDLILVTQRDLVQVSVLTMEVETPRDKQLRRRGGLPVEGEIYE